MFKYMTHSRYKCFGSLIFSALTMTLFFISPLASFTGRWQEITLCMVCLTTAGWVGHEQMSNKASFYLTVILAICVCTLPWLLHHTFRDSTDSDTGVVALIFVISIFTTLAMHLGDRAKSFYLLLKNQNTDL